MYVLCMYYLLTGSEWLPNGNQLRSEEFDGIVFLKNNQKGFGFVKRRGSKKTGVCKMIRLIFYKNKILFSNFKKNQPFFCVHNLLIY